MGHSTDTILLTKPIILLFTMKKTILIQYGCFVRSVELPFPFSAASFEERLNSIFGFNGKDILGLRHPSKDRILLLDELKSDDTLISFAAEYDLPCLLVFHSTTYSPRLIG